MLRGISSVVLGYSRLDGGAARARVGKVSLFSDLMRGRPTACLREIHKACSLYIVCVNIRILWVDSPYLSLCYIILSSLYTFLPSYKGLAQSQAWVIVREKPDFGC